jgi:hypothetical protein
MKTMYDEGLIAQDFFSYSDASCGAMINAGESGALCWWTLEHTGNQFADIICANPIPLGDVTDVNDIHVSRLKQFDANRVWASASYEEPRILAMLCDFVYSMEGSMIYRYGFSQEAGGDPLNIAEAWYLNDKGEITNAKVEDKSSASISDYGRKYLFPNDGAGLRPVVYATGHEGVVEYTDSVTGAKYTVANNVTLTDDNNDGHWRLITIEKWSKHATSIRLPDPYMAADVVDDYTDKKNAVNSWINAETVKFITGIRPISEIETFWKELEDLGVKDYLQYVEAGYADYMALTFPNSK